MLVKTKVLFLLLAIPCSYLQKIFLPLLILHYSTQWLGLPFVCNEGLVVLFITKSNFYKSLLSQTKPHPQSSTWSHFLSHFLQACAPIAHWLFVSQIQMMVGKWESEKVENWESENLRGIEGFGKWEKGFGIYSIYGILSKWHKQRNWVIA